jgi:hypothetical protein
MAIALNANGMVVNIDMNSRFTAALIPVDPSAGITAGNEPRPIRRKPCDMPGGGNLAYRLGRRWSPEQHRFGRFPSIFPSISARTGCRIRSGRISVQTTGTTSGRRLGRSTIGDNREANAARVLTKGANKSMCARRCRATVRYHRSTVKVRHTFP